MVLTFLTSTGRFLTEKTWLLLTGFYKKGDTVNLEGAILVIHHIHVPGTHVTSFFKKVDSEARRPLFGHSPRPILTYVGGWQPCEVCIVSTRPPHHAHNVTFNSMHQAKTCQYVATLYCGNKWVSPSSYACTFSPNVTMCSRTTDCVGRRNKYPKTPNDVNVRHN